MEKILLTLVITLLPLISHANEQTAEQLVASKVRADMTYKQLMEIMGRASTMIHEGILRENKQLVKEGANIILNHPAPKHKPWTIMHKSDHKSFKKSLLAFDKILDVHAQRALKEAKDENWIEANDALHQLNTSCISCHSMWKNKVN